MAVITEFTLRSKLKNEKIDKLFIEKKDIITPSARQYLKDKGIEIIIGKEECKNNSEIETKEEKAKYVCEYTGGFFNEKPEYMTQLFGNRLVHKNHDRIILRGKIDTLQSKIIALQLIFKEKKKEKIVSDLQDVLQFVRNMLKAEVMDSEMEEMFLLEMDEKKIREISHHPKKYFNIDHLFLIDHTTDEGAVYLNELRTFVREVEIYAINAFLKNGKAEREDILKGLNRLSSCIYIMMLKGVSGKYK